MRMLEYDFQSNIGHWICMTAHSYQRVVNEELMPQGITYRQCQVLGWLAFEGDLSQTELAQRMKIEPPTLVGVLDRMEADGLLARGPAPNDRRRKLIKPLPKARALWEKILVVAERIRDQATAGMTEKEIETLKGLLARVQSNLGYTGPVKKLT
jgi:MarR family transcriptional regulator for hemolysin